MLKVFGPITQTKVIADDGSVYTGPAMLFSSPLALPAREHDNLGEEKVMDRQIENVSAEQFEADFDRSVRHDDDTASQALLAAGRPIHFRKPDTPPSHVVRKHPDGREELVHIDISQFVRRRSAER